MTRQRAPHRVTLAETRRRCRSTSTPAARPRGLERSSPPATPHHCLRVGAITALVHPGSIPARSKGRRKGRCRLQERGKRVDESDSLAPICRAVACGALQRRPLRTPLRTLGAARMRSCEAAARGHRRASALSPLQSPAMNRPGRQSDRRSSASETNAIGGNPVAATGRLDALQVLAAARFGS